VANVSTTRLLEPRSQLQLTPGVSVCPDLALVTVATDKLWLAIEIISPDDHHSDTVVKKQIYEELKLPRLWIVDPRYDNVEVYHGSPYGLSLKGILAGREMLTEKLLPGFELSVAKLFARQSGPA
jgi:Uma2 family endonuclease